MGVRRKGRELAVQILYLMDVTHLDMEKSLRSVMASDNVDPESKKYAITLVHGTVAAMPEIDDLINKVAKNWELMRMAALDRNILRLGTYELIHAEDTPTSVIINEAVEIAKIFSTDDSGKFVNGILDKMKSERHELKEEKPIA